MNLVHFVPPLAFIIIICASLSLYIGTVPPWWIFIAVISLWDNFALSIVSAMAIYSASSLEIATMLWFADVHPKDWLWYVTRAPVVDFRSWPSPAKSESENISRPPPRASSFSSYFMPYCRVWCTYLIVYLIIYQCLLVCEWFYGPNFPTMYEISGLVHSTKYRKSPTSFWYCYTDMFLLASCGSDTCNGMRSIYGSAYRFS